MTDIIQGDKFEKVGDFTYSPAIKIPGDYSRLPNTFAVSRLKDLNIVYTHTFYVKQLFAVISSLSQKFIIITHNCDYNVDDSYMIPDNVFRWFTQNVKTDNPKVHSLPIGLENNRWFPEQDKKGKMQRKLQQPKKFKRMLYLNHSIRTNPAERQKPYDLFKGLEWVTIGNGANGEGFDNYLDNIYNHPFVICPQGNGIDTHRTWECLYVNTIPVEKRNLNNRFYNDLPICFVDDWEQITEKFLYDEYLRIVEAKWNTDKLTFSYWKNLINQSRN